MSTVLSAVIAVGWFAGSVMVSWMVLMAVLACNFKREVPPTSKLGEKSRPLSLSLMASSNELTEYERKRLENIRRNGEMIAALNIHTKASELSANTKRQRVGSSKSYKVSLEKKKPKIQSPVVIRRSLRTRGLPPDSNGIVDDSNDSTTKPAVPIHPKKPLASVLGQLSMRDAYTGTGSDRALIDTLKGLVTEEKPRLGVSTKEEFDDEARDGVSFRLLKGVSDNPKGRVTEEKPQLGVSTKEEFDEEARDGVSFTLVKGGIKNKKLDFGMGLKSDLDLGSMDLKPENIARLLQGKILVVYFLPREDVRMVAAGNKYGDVAFWNMDFQGKKDEGIYLYSPHNGPISGILFQRACLSKVFTSCYHGFIRLMDVEKEVFDLVYNGDEAIYTLSQQPNEMKNLYLSEGHGGLSIWDERMGKFASQWILHEDRINTIDFNPQNPFIMATSSTDWSARLWDLRSISRNKPSCLKTFSHKRPVHSAYFSPYGVSLATTSTDDRVGVFNGVNFEETSMIPHNNYTGRWISNFRAIWGWDDSHIFIGSMKRGVDVISPAQRRTIMTLQSPDLTAIPCRFAAHPYKVGMLAGATGGGQVYVWTSN
ncbi:hypothetical protein K2173_017886 [Erythroxylum novogranatense]|uniref:WD repeat-containing protein 76 n=1 Tax=Erythroxylum novogranatense TaxID=1862640 RepID=A0AAV8SLZ1_9ROSI|nr:hypothetical protein K2173_017886 [Erythroxylum novogranatense]